MVFLRVAVLHRFYCTECYNLRRVTICNSRLFSLISVGSVKFSLILQGEKLTGFIFSKSSIWSFGEKGEIWQTVFADHSP